MEGSARFTLDDGETVIVADEDLRRVYDLIWRLVPRRGAVSAAALIRARTSQSEVVRRAITLDADQSAVLREAIAILRGEG